MYPNRQVRQVTDRPRLLTKRWNSIVNLFVLPAPILYVHLLYIGNKDQGKKKIGQQPGKRINYLLAA
jgi:hypothetical protein